MTKPLSDEEMAQLESQAPAKKALSDDEMAALEAQHAPKPGMTKLDSAVAGGFDGASMGFRDELSGAVEALGSLGGVRGLGGGFSDIHRATPEESKEGFTDAYRAGRDAKRQLSDKARSDNPLSYMGGQFAGSLAVPGGGGAKLGAQVIRGGMQGAIAGLGESRAKDGGSMVDSFDNLKDSLGDAGFGGLVGLAVPVGLKGAGKVVSAVKDTVRPSRVASVLLGAPEEAVELYLKNPKAVNEALPRSALTERTMRTLDDLKAQVQGGSQQSRQILADEGARVSGDSIADIMQRRADAITQRSEGVVDDPQTAAALKWLQETSEKYRPVPGVDGAAPTPRELSTNRVKDILQGIDRTTEYDIGAGKFGRIDDTVKKGVRSEVDELLKSQSPAYREQMVGVAGDTDLLSRASDLAGTPQAMDNLLKRVERDRAYFPAQTLKELDGRMGTDLMGDLKLSAAKEAFDKSATNGSRNVNLYRGMMGDLGRKSGIPLAEMGGAAFGATVDKYGPKMAKSLVDATLQVQNRLGSSEGLQSLGKFAKPLVEAAKRGNQNLAVTHLLLMKDPEYAALYEGQ